MQTNLPAEFLQTRQGKTANEILRSCVHCGFCNATCPTYQLLGDEQDGPRGRIYLIKQLLEGKASGEKTQLHLDRCLQCLNCETTCPSGVKYHHLLDIGQQYAARQLPQPFRKRLLKRLILHIMPYSRRFASLLALGRLLRFALPPGLASQLPHPKTRTELPTGKTHVRKMILLKGCVHDGIDPSIHPQSIAVLDKLGIQLEMEKRHGCCGAIAQHLQKNQLALRQILDNLERWGSYLDQGYEAIISNASGCGQMIKDYRYILQQNGGVSSFHKQLADKVLGAFFDISEVIAAQPDLSSLTTRPEYKHIAYHPPCTLQHGQKLPDIVETILARLQVNIFLPADKHLCCGSAGTYSLFRPQLANQLRDNKLQALTISQVDVIATANIGCLHHLQSGTNKPVIHWLELIDTRS